MAITRIHAIKASVSGAVDYICDKDKTDSRTLITSFATSPETAADDFKFVLSHTDSSGPNKAYHLIQSFAPGETDAAQAHEIGVELADKLLEGKYSYIVSTHTDKDHVHNHILFCAADNFDYKKYHDCKRSYYFIRQLNDRICEEHNLSVLREDKNIGMKYKEWSSRKAGTSWKSTLMHDINACIKNTNTYDDFLSRMQAMGYEIKDSGFDPGSHKYIAFRAPGQQRFIRGRAKSMGPDFTKERIRERIEEKAKIRTEKMLKKDTGSPSIIDTSADRFAQSAGLKHWADRENLKSAARMYAQLSEMGFGSLTEVDERIESLHEQNKENKKTVIALEKDIKLLQEAITFARQYTENRQYEDEYEKAKDKEKYYRSHRHELTLIDGARDRLKSLGMDAKSIDMDRLESMLNTAQLDRSRALDVYRSYGKEYETLNRMKNDLLGYVGDTFSRTTKEPLNRGL